MDQNFTKLMLTIGVLVGVLRWEISDLWADGTRAHVSSKYALAEPEPWELERNGRDEQPQQDAESAIQKRVLGYSHDGYFGPSFGLRYDTGDGVSVRKSFLTPQVFVPLLDARDQHFLFSDLRGVFHEEDLIAANVGLGYRLYSDLLERTLGLYVYYDYRDAQENGFHQVSPGFEVLGDTWDFRSNIYLPRVGDHRKTLPNQFAGNFLLVDRFQVAMTGADMELGVPLLSARDVRLFGGAYHFQGPGVPDVWGWKVRCEAELTDSIRTNLSVQDDDLFGTTVNFWMAFRFPAGRSRHQRRCHQGIRNRFYEPVERLQNVVVQTNPGTPALDLTNDEPLFFLHVAAGGNSDGSFEDPYAMLEDALTDSRYTGGQADVIYVRQNPAVRLDPDAGLQHMETVSLVSDTQLLSNGPLQSIATLQGDLLLPFSGVDRFLERLPKINAKVKLADNTVLSGFDIESTDKQRTVNGQDVSGLTIKNNRINNGKGDANRAAAIGFTRASGTVNIEGNIINQFKGRGIVFVESNITEGLVSDNVIGKDTGSNIEADNRGVQNPDPNDDPNRPTFDKTRAAIEFKKTNFSGDIRGNQVNANSGIGLYVNKTSTIEGMISSNTFNKNNRQGIVFDTSNFNGSIVDNDISGSLTGEGVVFVDSTFAGAINHNRINDNAYLGLAFFNTTFDGPVSISDNMLNNNAFVGMAIIKSSLQSGIIANNEIVNNTSAGGMFVWISGEADDAFDVQIVNNEIVNNTSAGGMFVWISGEADDAFDVQIVNNSLIGNNDDIAFDVLVWNTESGTLDLTLSGNSSTNVVPAGQFNFDLLNDGGMFNVAPNGVNAANDPGTVGSSDGSVVIP